MIAEQFAPADMGTGRIILNKNNIQYKKAPTPVGAFVLSEHQIDLFHRFLQDSFFVRAVDIQPDRLYLPDVMDTVISLAQCFDIPKAEFTRYIVAARGGDIIHPLSLAQADRDPVG